MIQDVELWLRELEAAGWRKYASTVWKSPSGHMFRGPYGAWCRMHEFPKLSVAAHTEKEGRSRE